MDLLSEDGFNTGKANRDLLLVLELLVAMPIPQMENSYDARLFGPGLGKASCRGLIIRLSRASTKHVAYRSPSRDTVLRPYLSG